MKHLLAAVGVTLSLGGLVIAQGTAPEKIYSRQKAFRIPFQIPGQADERQIQEVQLYVARDGLRWEKYTSAPPELPADKRNFTFRAEQDGEYWFSVRTQDRRGVLNPPNDEDLQPGLRVVVDSEIPRIRLRAMPRSGRDVGVQWEMDDRNLDLNTFRIEYRNQGQDTYRAVPGVAPKVAGYVTWVPDGQGQIWVRAQVQDKAQNLGISSCEIEAEGTGGRALPSFVDRGAPPSRSRTGIADEPATGYAAPPAREPFERGSALERGSAPSGAIPVADTRSTGPGFPTSTAPTAFREPPPMRDSDRAIDTASSPTGYRPGNSASPASATTSGPLPSNRQIMRDKDLSLNYELEDVGPSGVGGVELYVTTDMGRSWQLYGPDADAKPPFVVELPKEGLYGLSLIARSGVGLGDQPPQSGDVAQVWVEVDRSPPQARLISAEPGRGPEGGTVIITWQAADPNLSDRPISFYYNDPTTGEWRTIVAGVDNSGRYVWPLPTQVPPRFRIRMEVVDLAGNRQVVESSDVTVDTSKPKARVIGIAPAGSTRR